MFVSIIFHSRLDNSTLPCRFEFTDPGRPVTLGGSCDPDRFCDLVGLMNQVGLLTQVGLVIGVFIL